MKKASFMDFELDTEAVTLRPRFETEILVEKAVSILRETRGGTYPYRVLDLGTGSGNIAISLTKYLPASRIVALDISESSLRAARKNARTYAADDRIDFKISDLFGALGERDKGSFDMIVSNPPYVALADFPSLSGDVKDEPYVALYGGRDGLDFYRKIAKKAPFFLKEKAFLLLEVGYNQAGEVKKILRTSTYFGDPEIIDDYNDIARFVKVRLETRHG